MCGDSSRCLASRCLEKADPTASATFLASFRGHKLAMHAARDPNVAEWVEWAREKIARNAAK